MKYIVSYDISNTNNRTKLHKFLKESGLISIQKSVFFGELTIKNKSNLLEGSLKFFNNKKDSLLFIGINSEDFHNFRRVGSNIDLMEVYDRYVEIL